MDELGKIDKRLAYLQRRRDEAFADLDAESLDVIQAEINKLLDRRLTLKPAAVV